MNNTYCSIYCKHPLPRPTPRPLDSQYIPGRPTDYPSFIAPPPPHATCFRHTVHFCFLFFCNPCAPDLVRLCCSRSPDEAEAGRQQQQRWHPLGGEEGAAGCGAPCPVFCFRGPEKEEGAMAAVVAAAVGRAGERALQPTLRLERYRTCVLFVGGVMRALYLYVCCMRIVFALYAHCMRAVCAILDICTMCARCIRVVLGMHAHCMRAV